MAGNRTSLVCSVGVAGAAGAAHCNEPVELIPFANWFDEQFCPLVAKFAPLYVVLLSFPQLQAPLPFAFATCPFPHDWGSW